ncbi:MAG TPA: outer membrane protein transport protein [Polyangia bacterium]|nr:outer membrane protein transport protein [Polyangia bacterium]
MPGRWWLALGGCRWFFACLLPILSSPGLAAPLDEPFVGGVGFNGPTAANLGAVYWNPAALGLVRGFQVMVGGTMHLSRISVNRTGVDGAGQPDLALPPMATATARDLTQPFQWPPGPGSFVGISTDLGGDRFTLAFATYEPFLEQVHFTASPGDPTRYHRIDADLRNLALVPALAIRFGSDLRIGVAPGFMFSTGRMSFAEQTVPGSEVASTDARYDLASGQSIGDSRFAVTLGGGVYFRRKTVEFGISYSSRPLGSDVGGIEVAADKTRVTRPTATGGAPVTCPSGQADRCVFGDIVYRLPDVWIAGAAWHPRPGAEIAVMARWIWFHLHDRIDVRLTSPALQAAGLPDHIVFHRGFKDVWDARVRVAYWIRERVRLGAALRLETGAMASSDVNPGAVDGFKIEPMMMAELRISRNFSVSAGYGFSYMPEVTARPSSFDPLAAAACDAAGGDLRNPNCMTRLQGRARPSAEGSYARTVSDFSASLSMRF